MDPAELEDKSRPEPGEGRIESQGDKQEPVKQVGMSLVNQTELRFCLKLLMILVCPEGTSSATVEPVKFWNWKKQSYVFCLVFLQSKYLN